MSATAPRIDEPQLPRGSDWLTPFRARLLLAGVMTVAVVLRLESIAGHLSNDEGYSYLVGSAPSAGEFLRRLADYENTPPLFYLLLTPLPLDHAAWLRLPAVIPGVLIPLVLYFALRRPLGERVGLLAAALVAVAPYHVSYSDYSRGFMLEGLGCMVALLAMLRIVSGGDRRWWWLYAVGGVVAVYSEYFGVIFLVALTAAAVAFAGRDRLIIAGLGLMPNLALLPWLGQIARGQRQLHHTKQFAQFPGPSLTTLRNVTVRLALGEHGAGSTSGLRWLEFLAILSVLAVAGVVLYRAVRTDGAPRGRQMVLVLATTGLLVVLGHALVSEVGTGSEIFNERYFTVLIPIGAALIAIAIAQARLRWIWLGAMAAAGVVAVAVFVQRYDRQYEPSLAPIAKVVGTLHPRTVLTNSAVVVFYLHRFSPILDRPFGLGASLERSCPSPCVVVDDSRVPGGVRPGPGPSHTFGFFNVRLASDAKR